MPEVKDTQTAAAQETALPAAGAPETAPAAPKPPRKKPAGKGRRKLIKRLIAFGTAAAILGRGGFAPNILL